MNLISENIPEANNAYNRFVNLDSVQDRIIVYLLNQAGKDENQKRYVNQIRQLLYYSDDDALSKPVPSYGQIAKLICNDDKTQDDKRIFRSPFLEENFNVECTMLKIYIDSIYPANRITATVNIGIDILTHVKKINVAVPDDSAFTATPIDFDEDGNPIVIDHKSRIDVLLKSILYLLNGTELQMVGKLSFDRQLSNLCQSRLGLWNNSNFLGHKLVMSTLISGVN